MIMRFREKLKNARVNSVQRVAQKKRAKDLKKDIPVHRVKRLDGAVSKVVKEYGETLRMLKNT